MERNGKNRGNAPQIAQREGGTPAGGSVVQTKRAGVPGPGRIKPVPRGV
jgi:hypothetical protein